MSNFLPSGSGGVFEFNADVRASLEKEGYKDAGGPLLREPESGNEGALSFAFSSSFMAAVVYRMISNSKSSSDKLLIYDGLLSLSDKTGYSTIETNSTGAKEALKKTVSRVLQHCQNPKTRSMLESETLRSLYPAHSIIDFTLPGRGYALGTAGLLEKSICDKVMPATSFAFPSHCLALVQERFLPLTENCPVTISQDHMSIFDQGYVFEAATLLKSLITPRPVANKLTEMAQSQCERRHGNTPGCI